MTLRINLYGGPGTGKSTTAAAVFSRLKQDGINAEYVSEFAKDLTWSKNFEGLAFQPLIAGEQQWREQRLEGKVDAMVSDTSSLLGLVYDPDSSQQFKDWIIYEYTQHHRLNVMLTRNKNRKYNPAGRSQTEDEAKRLDSRIASLLAEHKIPVVYVPVSEDFSHVEAVVEIAKHRVTLQQLEKSIST